MEKIQHAWQVKRRFRIKESSQQIQSLTGADSIEWSRDRTRITVIYDIRTADYQTILQNLADAGVVVQQGLWSRWMGRFYQSSDHIGRENASARPSPCCNKPPK